MKKLLITCVLCAFSVGFAFAHTVGVKGNFNMNLGSTLEDTMQNYIQETARTNDLNLSYPVVLGGGATVYFRYNLPNIPALGFQGELGLAINNGIAYKMSDSTGELKDTISYTSLEIPVLLTYDFDVNDKISVRLLAGPNFSFPLAKLTETTKTTGSGISNTNTGKMNISHFAFGLAAGVAGAFKVGSGSFIAELRYTNDFSKIVANQESGGLKVSVDLMTRRFLSISAGYEFKF